MKLLLAQINTTVGAFETNTKRVLEALDKGREQGAELVVFPELTITGYPPKDLLYRAAFVEENERRLKQIAGATTGLTAIVGYVARNDDAEGKGLFNAAAVCADGEVVSRHFKSLIPTYDVFDEGRYFDAGPGVVVAEINGARVGITICEDCWNDRLYWSRRLYENDPVEDLVERNIELLINISASPFNLGKTRVRHDMFASLAKRHGLPIAHVNLVGGADGLLFDGASAVFDASGRPHEIAKSFDEDLLYVDLEATVFSDATIGASEEMADLHDALVMGTRDYLRKCHFKKAIVGLSGGIDSAITCAIAARALGPENVYGVSMPSRYSSDHSKDDAASLAKNLGVDYRQIPIEPGFTAMNEMLESSFEGLEPDVTEENIQARLRGVTLMALSNKFNAMVLTTGNKSESAVGYATLYGDMCGGLAVISDVPKVMVYDLARWMNRDGEVIPWNTIDKPPSAELRPDQLDSDSLPDYDVLDPILRAYVEEHKSVEEIVADGLGDQETVARVARMIDLSEYKRQQAAPGLRVTTKAFGYGRRMPIAAYD